MSNEPSISEQDHLEYQAWLKELEAVTPLPLPEPVAKGGPERMRKVQCLLTEVKHIDQVKNSIVYQPWFDYFTMNKQQNNRLYFYVFQPYKKTYDSNKSYYQSKKFIDDVQKYIYRKCRNEQKVFWYMVTREVNASQIHVNLLVYASDHIDFSTTVGKQNLFAAWRQEYFKPDAVQILRFQKYIFKELTERSFDRYLDFDMKLVSLFDDESDESDVESEELIVDEPPLTIRIV